MIMIDLLSVLAGAFGLGYLGRVMMGGGGQPVTGGGQPITGGGQPVTGGGQPISNTIALGAMGAYQSQDHLGAAHCWDFIERVGQRAGVRSWVDVWRGVDYKGSGGAKYLPLEQHTMIQPGDHIVVYNANKYDRLGNHSAIFIRWVSPYTVAETVDLQLPGKPPRLINRDLSVQRVSWVRRGA